jgi:hypothetical protein
MTVGIRIPERMETVSGFTHATIFGKGLLPDRLGRQLSQTFCFFLTFSSGQNTGVTHGFLEKKKVILTSVPS